MTGPSESVGECCSAPWLLRIKEVEALAPPARIWVHYLKKLEQILTVVRLASNLRDNCSRSEQNEIFPSVSLEHVRLQFGSNIPHTRTLPYTTQQAPMKLKLAEGVYNRMRLAVGQLLAPRGFG